MKTALQALRQYITGGTDRQLFRRSLIFLILLVASVQAGIATGHWLVYLLAFVATVLYVYIWLELLQRFFRNRR